jgi:hypothetical protein
LSRGSPSNAGTRTPSAASRTRTRDGARRCSARRNRCSGRRRPPRIGILRR